MCHIRVWKEQITVTGTIFLKGACVVVWGDTSHRKHSLLVVNDDKWI